MILAQELTITIRDTTAGTTLPVDFQKAERGSLSLSYSGEDDKHVFAMPSELRFTMHVEDYSDAFFKDLFTGNENRYEVTLSGDEDGSTITYWTGFLLPDTYSEPYVNGGLYVNFTATDGLGRLRGVELDAVYYDTTRSVTDFIAACLRATGLEQPIYIAPGIKNDYMGDDWSKIFINGKPFGKDNKRDDARKVLDSLLGTLGLQLYTWKGAWHLLSPNRVGENPRNHLRYNPQGGRDGNHLQSSLQVPLQMEASPRIDLKSPYQKVVWDWAIEEDDVLPDDIIRQPYTQLFSFTAQPAVRHWQSIGGATLSLQRADLPVYDGSLTNFNDPLYNYVTTAGAVRDKSYVTISGRQGVNSYQRYMHFISPPYLTGLDKTIDFTLSLVAQVHPNDIYGWGNVNDVDNLNLDNTICYELYIDNRLVAGNTPRTPNRDAFRMEYTKQSQSGFGARHAVTGKVSFKDFPLQVDGRLNLRIFQVRDSANHYSFQHLVVSQLTMDYSSDEQHIWTLTRPIDYTTVQELDSDWGDSRNSICTNRFLLQASAGSSDSDYAVKTIISAGNVSGIGQNHGHLVEVSLTDYQAMAAAQGNLYLRRNGQTFWEHLAQVEFKALQIPAFSATRYFLKITLPDGYLVQAPGSQFGQPTPGDELAINTVTAVVPQDDPAVIAAHTTWSQVNQPNEGLRFGRVRAQLDHNLYNENPLVTPSPTVHPEGPIATMEGTAFGLLDPTDLLEWEWDGSRKWFATDMTLALDLGMTDIRISETRAVPVETTANLDTDGDD